jgi:CelD/BcsL family acetyltransferase involved in cellulose biosynthesis
MMTQLTAMPARSIRLPDGWIVESYDSLDLPDRIVDAWRNLAAQFGDAHVFVSLDWYKLWWRAFGQNQRLTVLAVFEGSSCRAIVPCCRTTRNGQDAAVCLTNDHTFFHDILAQPGSRAQAIRFFFEAANRLGLLAPLHLECISSSLSSSETITGVLTSMRVPFKTHELPWSPYIDIQQYAGWEQYEKSIHPKLKNNLKRGRKKAEAEGLITFEIHEGGPQLDVLLSDAFRVENNSWKGERGTAIICDPGTEEFYRAVARHFAARGMFRLYLLRLEGVLIAFEFCIVSGQTVFSLKTGYDQSVAARFSPGNILRADIIRSLIESRPERIYTLLGRAYPWKLEWTSSTDIYHWFEIFPPSLTGWGRYIVRYGWKEQVKRSPALTRFAERFRAL